MSQVGRISGPLLFSNLERNGIDLTFSNTLSETALLKLHVNNGKVSVNKPSATKDLDIDGRQKSTTYTTTTASIADLDFATNNIDALVGNINVVAGDLINISRLETQNLLLETNRILTFSSNEDIVLDPNGTGTVEIVNDLNVTGSLHSTKDITFDGNIIFGNSIADDTVTINAQIDSSIIPTENETFNLGSADYNWNEIRANSFNVDTIVTNQLISNNVDLTYAVGNTFYVAVNGSDSNTGNSPQAPFATIRHALNAVDASTQGPVTISIFPGEYQEELPLEVPSNVTVMGVDYRNTIVMPDTSSQSENVFLLNGESTISSITVKDFYYDSVNDKGYAFSFAPNATVTTRSPYIQNCTVLTKGSVTSASDPRGFNEGDAGKGALVDGAQVLSTSQEASMLFHSVTFITPGVDGLTMTNGVRVEWLNSFTYFANRGLYAKNGTTGHLSTDGSTINYGAEIRSIGSANVYGNYGAEADGDDTLMYLIQHNFGYIGTGKFLDNDPSRAVQSQETTTANDGKIYFQSVDHLGNFRVGEQFVANQETGSTSLVLTEGDIDSLGGLRVTSNGGVTILDGDGIDVGNLRLSGNSITTISGDMNFSATGQIRMTSDVNMAKNLTVDQDFDIEGVLNDFGDAPTDSLTFEAEVASDILPNTTGVSTLGSASRKWKKAWLSEANIGDIQFKDNYVTTDVSNADLEFRASGTGEILLPDNNLNVTNDLLVVGETTLKDTTIDGTVTYTGDWTMSASPYSTYAVTGDMTVSSIDVGQGAPFKDIEINGNTIFGTVTNQDVQLKAAGTGTVVFRENVNITQDLSVQDITVTNVTLDNNIDLEEINSDNSDINIFDNVITTTTSNSNLELRTSGTGSVFAQNISIARSGLSSTETQDSTLTDLVLRTNDLIIDSVGSIELPRSASDTTTGNLSFNIANSNFQGYNSEGVIQFGGLKDSDLDTNILTKNQEILFRVANTQVGRIGDNSTAEFDSLRVDDVQLSDNQISVFTSNDDLELRANGTGRVTMDNLQLYSNYIHNTSTDAGTFVTPTGNGYIKIANTFGVRIPTGVDADRNTTPILGETRYSTENVQMEVYNGTDWIPAAGDTGGVTEEEMTDEAQVMSLIFG